MLNHEPQENQCSDLWVFLTTEVEEERTTLTPTTTAQTLINQYISLPLEKRLSIPLDFWIKHQSLLGSLFKIAVKYSIIPATSVPSERVFFQRHGN